MPMGSGGMFGTPPATTPGVATGGMFGGRFENPLRALAMIAGPAMMAKGFNMPGLANMGPQMLGLAQQSRQSAQEAARKERELKLKEAAAARDKAMREQVASMFGAGPAPSAAPAMAGAPGGVATAAMGAPTPAGAPGMMGAAGAGAPGGAPAGAPAAMGGMFGNLSDQDRKTAAAMALDDPVGALKFAAGRSTAQSPIGKLQGDLAAGRISQDQYNQALSVMQRPLVSMPGQQTEEAKQVGKWYGQQYTTLQDAAGVARQDNARLDTMNALLEDVYTGAGGERVLAGKKLAALMGADPEGIGNAEAAQALANEMALKARNPAGGAGMPGAMSDKDREFLAGMQPGLAMTKDGRETLIMVRKRTNQRSIEVARMARNYRKKKGRLDEAFFDELDAKFSGTSMFGDIAPAGDSGTTIMNFDAAGNLLE